MGEGRKRSLKAPTPHLSRKGGNHDTSAQDHSEQQDKTANQVASSPITFLSATLFHLNACNSKRFILMTRQTLSADTKGCTSIRPKSNHSDYTVLLSIPSMQMCEAPNAADPLYIFSVSELLSLLTRLVQRLRPSTITGFILKTPVQVRWDCSNW